MSFIDEYKSGVRDLAKRQTHLQNRYADLKDPPADPLHLVDVRDRYESAYKSLGIHGSPQPMPSESVFTYRRRLASGLQHCSDMWREANIFNLDTNILDAAEPEILQATAAYAADRTRPNPDGSLRAIHSVTDAGHPVTLWAGNPLSWMAKYMRPGFAVRQFKNSNGTSIHVQRKSLP